MKCLVFPVLKFLVFPVLKFLVYDDTSFEKSAVSHNTIFLFISVFEFYLSSQVYLIMALELPITAWISIISSSIIVLFQFLFITSLIYSFYCSSKHNGSKFKSIKYTSLGTFICIGLAFTIWIIEEILFRKYGQTGSDIWLPWFISFFTFIGISFFLFYILMLLRLHFTFQDTDFQINNITVKFHGVLIFLIMTFGPICVFIKINNYNDWIYYGLVMILLIICSVSSLHLIYLFNKKLFDLTISVRQSLIMVDPYNSEQKGELVLNERQLRMLKTIRKQTLLGCMVVGMIIMSVMIIGCYALFRIYAIWWIGWMFTWNTGTLCVFLGFTVNQSRYNCICILCDFLCKKLCERMVEKRIERERELHLNEMSDMNRQSSHHSQIRSAESIDIASSKIAVVGT